MSPDAFRRLPLAVRMGRGLIGILAGVAAGAGLSVVFLVGPGEVLADITRVLDVGYHVAIGRPLTARIDDPISVGVWGAAVTWAAAAGAVAVPLWIGLGRLGRSGRIDALWLGALVGAPFGLLFEGADKLMFAPRLAAVGAIAGLVTWFAAHWRTKARRASLELKPAS